MLKYVDTREVFLEVPNEISLAINFSGCPIKCEGCHSSYLWKDEGEFLTTLKLKTLIETHMGITCVCFMGGDAQPWEINNLAYIVKHNFHLKVAWYSGQEIISSEIELQNFNYIKIGGYQKDLGGLDSPTTNQRFYEITENKKLIDLTYKFKKNEYFS